MKMQEALKQMDSLTAKLKLNAANVIAEKATAYYKARFTDKSWEGIPWKAAKQPPKRGSLMLRSGKLMSTIRPVSVSASLVRIRAGSPQVPYAQIHNEGGIINHPGGTPFFFDSKKNKAVFVSKQKASMFKEPLPITKPHPIPIPRRQYMGTGKLFADYIINALKTANILK
jgi:hypothetical protein